MDRVARATAHVDTQFFRALAVLRGITLVFAIGVNAARSQDLAHQRTAWVLIGVMVLWSGAVTWVYDRPELRRWWVVLLDLAIAVVLLRTTTYVETDAMIGAGDWTLTTYWVVTPVIACAVRWGAFGGLAAAVLVQTADVTLRTTITSSTVGNVFLMIAAALLVGYCAQAIRVAATQRASAERSAALAAERERLARVVHDGVLQVLALVQRRGSEIGGAAADLGRLAGEQEVALRALVQSAGDDEGQDEGVLDVGAALNALSSPKVTVSIPGRAVPVSRAVVSELVAVAQACLDNTYRHAEGAHTWVLLEDDAEQVRVSIRDDGPGMRPERADEAAFEGRMGIAKSIRGRVKDLGGTASLVTAPGQGTEWELVVPRAAYVAR